MAQQLHKIIYIVPSACRLEFEKVVEELMAGREGFRHAGSYVYDPDKPQFFQRPKRATNGAKAPPPPKKDLDTKILETMAAQPRPFTTYELMQLFSASKTTVSMACARLITAGKIKSLQRGIYAIVHAAP